MVTHQRYSLDLIRVFLPSSQENTQQSFPHERFELQELPLWGFDE